MLVLPVAQENSVVRRTPWVSFTLIALNFLALVLVSLTDEQALLREIRTRAGEVLGFIEEHPHLEAPETVTRHMRNTRYLGELEERRRSAPVPPSDQLQIEEEQLAALTARFEESWRRMPVVRWGYTPAEGGVAAIASSIFMHAGWMHLLGNMLFLFLTGPFIEDRYGRPLFTVFYLASGAAATLSHAAHDPASLVPLVGASGAIAGLMGAFLVRLGASRIRFLVWPMPIPFIHWRYSVLLPAFVVLPL